MLGDRNPPKGLILRKRFAGCCQPDRMMTA
jgi:hypothetical protein